MYEKTTMQSLLKTISVVVCLSVAQPVFADKQPDNIIQCFSCFLKKFSDWTWEQEKTGHCLCHGGLDAMGY